MVLTPEQKQKNKELRKQQKWNEEHKIINGVDHKICNLHHVYFPEESPWIIATSDYYYTNIKNSVDGLSNRCQECEKKRTIEWRKNNPKKRSVSDKKYNALSNTKMIKRICEQSRREQGKLREWQNKNKDKGKVTNKNRQHKNHNINKQEWENCKKYFDYKCAYCGLPITEHYYNRLGVTKLGDFHKEHVIHNGKNDLSNCVPSCQVCNSEKHNTLFEDWYNNDNIKYTEKRYNRIQKWLHEDYKKYIIIKKERKKYTRKPKTT